MRKYNFNKVMFWHGCSLENLQYIFRQLFTRTSLESCLWVNISKFAGNNNGGVSTIQKVCIQLIQKDSSSIDYKLYFMQFRN